jgi:hypothetical protein
MKTPMEGSDVYALLRASYDRQKAQAAATAGEDRVPGTPPRPGRPSPKPATPKQQANKNDGDLDDDT